MSEERKDFFRSLAKELEAREKKQDSPTFAGPSDHMASPSMARPERQPSLPFDFIPLEEEEEEQPPLLFPTREEPAPLYSDPSAKKSYTSDFYCPEEGVELDPTYFAQRVKVSFSSKLSGVEPELDEDILYGRAKVMKIQF